LKQSLCIPRKALCESVLQLWFGALFGGSE